MLSIEFFIAESVSGPMVMMAAPVRNGLRQADTLRVSGLSLLVLGNRAVLPIDLPDITETVRAALLTIVEAGGQLAVGEFTALGLFDSYFLSLDIK